MRNLLLPILLLLSFTHIAAQRAYSPDEVPNVNLRDRREFVADPEGLMSPEARQRVNQLLSQVRAQTTAEVAVAIVPSIGDLDPESFTEELFRKWGIGKADKDNGVLLLIAPSDRIARIETGYGAEGTLTDAAAATIIRNEIAPAMREGRLDAAVEGATASIAQALTDPAYADELRSASNAFGGQTTESLDSEVFEQFLMLIAGCAFLIGAGIFFSDLISMRKRKQYARALVWNKHLATFIILGILSCGAGLIFALLAWWLGKYFRNRPIPCDTCGTKMRKLSEEEDNSLLNPAQDLEERLDTVDYDVWLCPKCGTVERFPFKRKQTKYSECPACHTVAMCLVCEKTLTPATTTHAGHGERIYECKYCNNRRREPFVIPKKESAALAAAVIAGAAASRGGGGFGGGGFGGGFGGGASGGGGATGGW